MTCNITQNVLPAMNTASDAEYASEEATIEAYNDTEYSLSLYADELSGQIVKQIEDRANDELPDLLAKLLIKHYGRNGFIDRAARDIVQMMAKFKVDRGL